MSVASTRQEYHHQQRGAGASRCFEPLVQPSTKTATSILRDYCDSIGVTPQYDCLQTEGCFIYRATAGGVMCTGDGRSKKAAKHRASENALWELRHSMTEEHKKLFLPGTMFDAFNGVHVSPEDTSFNPIGELQEYAVAHHWRMPIYELIDELGPAHQRGFVMRVKLNGMVEKGVGRSKKIAKRAAAIQMLKRVRQMPVREYSECDLSDEDTSDDEILDEEYVNTDIYFRAPSSTPKSSHHAQSSHCDKNTLKISTGEKLTIAFSAEVSDTVDYLGTLTEFGLNSNFALEYELLDERSRTGSVLYFLKLNTIPAMVWHGRGATEDSAKQDAAKQMLSCLQILLNHVTLRDWNENNGFGLQDLFDPVPEPSLGIHVTDSSPIPLDAAP